MSKANQEASVLYADDDPGQRRLIQIVMNRIGWKLREASNGIEATELAAKESFDLILMDIRMPLQDGFQTVRRLRTLGVHVPVIALTALDYPELGEDCQAAGYNGWLVKPVTPQRLEHLMESYLASGSPR